jgi:hypothetical protein
MIGTGYFYTGISITYGYAGDKMYGWSLRLQFLDAGFANDDVTANKVSTEGVLSTRYVLRDENGFSGLEAGVKVIMEDARKMGIRTFAEQREDSFIRSEFYVCTEEEEESSAGIPEEQLDIVRKLAQELNFEIIGIPKQKK